jgi:hypothetical protein
MPMLNAHRLKGVKNAVLAHLAAAFIPLTAALSFALCLETRKKCW